MSQQLTGLSRKELKARSKANRIRESRGDRVFNGFTNLILVLAIALVAYPLLYVVSASFSSINAVMSGRVWIFPVEFSIKSYQTAFQYKAIMTGYLNSIIYTISGTAVSLVLTTLCAYPLSRRDLWGKNAIMMYATFPMFFSGGMIPTYLLVARTLGLSNSWWAVILVGGIATYNMIIMRTFFSNSIPYELQEAAQIDGCTPFGILVRIILPLSIPVMCVIGLYYGVFLWNSYFQSLIYLTDKDKWPLQLFLRQILVANDVSAVDGGASPDEMARRAMRAETIKYAIVVLASVPMLIIYPFVQRYFVKGVMIGSVKG